MKEFSRSDRVGSLILRNLSDILHRKIKDPRLENTVITGVDVSQDVKNARIYYSTPQQGKTRKDASEGFESALGYIKRTLASRLGLRYMPKIKFVFDESFDYGAHIEELISTIHAEDGADHTPVE